MTQRSIVLQALAKRPHSQPELVRLIDRRPLYLRQILYRLRQRGHRVVFDRDTKLYTLVWSPPTGVVRRRGKWHHYLPSGKFSEPYATAEEATHQLDRWIALCPARFGRLLR